MSALIAWTIAHHLPTLITHGMPSHHLYNVMHGYCASRGQSTAVAEYARHAVMYCYSR